MTKKKKPNILKTFFKYTSLNIIGMVGVSLYILIDTVFVAQGIGEDGLTAMNLAIPAFNLVHGTGLMLGVGSATLFSFYNRPGEEKRRRTIFSTGLVFWAILSAIFVVIGIFFSGTLTRWVGADETVYEMTHVYLQWTLLFAPFFLLDNLLLAMVRNDRGPKRVMFAMLFGSLINAVFDWIFIYPMNMGMLGAVLATGLSPVASILVLSGHWRKRKDTDLKWRKVKDPMPLIQRFCRVGFPSMITELSTGIIMVTLNLLIKKQVGNVGVAAYGIIANIYLVLISIFQGLADGAQPLFSYYAGQGEKRTMKKVLRYSLYTILGLTILLYGGTFLFSQPITAIFNKNNNPLLEEIAIKGLRLNFSGMFFLGANIVLGTYFICLRKTKLSHGITLGRGALLFVPVALLFSLAGRIEMLWLAQPVTELIVFLTAYGISKWDEGKKKREEKKEEQKKVEEEDPQEDLEPSKITA